MAADTPRRFSLNIVNASEDIPRLIRAYGRCCGGECALVLRPVEAQGALVHVTKEGATYWRGQPGEADAPRIPDVPCEVKDALTLIKTAQRALGRQGPITLKGSWRGHLICEDGAPRVELQRKLAAYGILRIQSDPEIGWRWSVERTEKWYSKEGTTEGEADTLARAIERGLANAMGLLGEACSFRDSRRRAAFDEPYAEAHPIRPAAERKDPTERLKVKETSGRKKSPSSPTPKSTRAPRGTAPAQDPPLKTQDRARALLNELRDRSGLDAYPGARFEILRRGGQIALQVSTPRLALEIGAAPGERWEEGGPIPPALSTHRTGGAAKMSPLRAAAGDVIDHVVELLRGLIVRGELAYGVAEGAPPLRYRLDGEEVDLPAFLAENPDLDYDLMVAINAMGPGERIPLGGGAAATFELTADAASPQHAPTPKPTRSPRATAPAQDPGLKTQDSDSAPSAEKDQLLMAAFADALKAAMAGV